MSRSTECVSVTLPPTILERLDDVARRESRSRSQQVSHVLKNWLEMTAEVTGERRLADLERIAAGGLSKHQENQEMIDERLCNSKEGTVPDSGQRDDRRRALDQERARSATAGHPIVEHMPHGRPGSRSTPR
jgi:predicted transcriptional regulator